jgi:hypothetical protein
VRWFFDSSVLAPALLPDHEHHARSFAAFAAASAKTAGCAAHSLAELYATLTRYPGKQRLSLNMRLCSCKKLSTGLPSYGSTAMTIVPPSATSQRWELSAERFMTG